MFGGLSFLLNSKMCCGVLKDILVVRVNPEDSDTLLKKPHVRPMDFTGRPLRGLVFVGPSGYETDEALKKWLLKAVRFTASLPSKESTKGV